MKMTIEELALGEREFLHDISNHIVVAQGMANSALRALQEAKLENLDPSVIDKLEKSVKAINKMITQVKERRTKLHSISGKTI